MDKNGQNGSDGQEWNGRWTSSSTDRSEKPTGQTANPRAISSVKAATLQIFRVFRAFRGQKRVVGTMPIAVFFACRRYL